MYFKYHGVYYRNPKRIRICVKVCDETEGKYQATIRLHAETNDTDELGDPNHGMWDEGFGFVQNLSKKEVISVVQKATGFIDSELRNGSQLIDFDNFNGKIYL